MKIALAQTRPVKGNVQKNIGAHKRFIQQAIDQGANAIIFPELSITGYEPSLANDLASTMHDERFKVFQGLSDDYHLYIGVGMPLRTGEGVEIGMVIFLPGKPMQVYSKQYLHEDEIPFFVPGEKHVLPFEQENKLALAICYELSVPAHSEDAFNNGSQIYLVSVAKTAPGVAKAIDILSGIAKKYSMMVLMVNCVGHCDDFDCGGRSSAWNSRGELIGQLREDEEGILVIDCEPSPV